MGLYAHLYSFKYLAVCLGIVLGIMVMIWGTHGILVKHVAHFLLWVSFMYKDNNIIQFDLCIYVTLYYHVVFQCYSGYVSNFLLLLFLKQMWFNSCFTLSLIFIFCDTLTNLLFQITLYYYVKFQHYSRYDFTITDWFIILYKISII